MSAFALDDSLIAELGWQQPRSAIQGVPNPLPNAGFAVPMPGTSDTIVQAIKFRLVTDSQAANRICVVNYLDADGVAFALIAAPFTQAASLTTDYTFAVGINEFGANDAANIGAGLPPFKLDVSHSIAVTIVAKQTGDQVSAIRLALQQWHVRP